MAYLKTATACLITCVTFLAPRLSAAPQAETCKDLFSRKSLSVPALSIQGVSKDNVNTSSLTPNQAINWNAEVSLQIGGDFDPLLQSNQLVYTLARVDGIIHVWGKLTDNDPLLGVQELTFDRETVVEFRGGPGFLQYSVSNGRIVAADVPLPRSVPRDGPEPFRLQFSLAGPYPNVGISLDFPDRWAFDGVFHAPGSAEWTNHYLVWMTGAGKTTEEDVETRKAALKKATQSTDLLVYRPSSISGYERNDIAGITDDLATLRRCGIPEVNLHFLASSAGVSPFEAEVYRSLAYIDEGGRQIPTKIGAVLMAQPLCPSLFGYYLLQIFHLSPYCQSPRAILPAIVTPVLHVVYDIAVPSFILPGIGSTNAGPSLFDDPVTASTAFYVLLGFDPDCDGINAVNLADRHIVALGNSETLAGNVLSHMTGLRGNADSAVQLANEQRRFGGMSLRCKRYYVPDVIDVEQTAAQRIIQGSDGLQLGSVAFTNIANVHAGRVVSQLPLPGTEVVEGTAVHIRVSTGSGISGDFNGDRNVDCRDWQVVHSAVGQVKGLGKFDPRADTNFDGSIDSTDYTFMLTLLPPGMKCP